MASSPTGQDALTGRLQVPLLVLVCALRLLQEASMLKEILSWVGVVCVAVLLYPVIRSGGWLDQAFGPWWLISIAAPCVIFSVVAGLLELRRRC